MHAQFIKLPSKAYSIFRIFKKKCLIGQFQRSQWQDMCSVGLMTWQETLESASPLQTIPSTFTSVEEYTATFEPLLYEEVRAQLLRDFEENGNCGWIQLIFAADKPVVAKLKSMETRDQFHFAEFQLELEKSKIFTPESVVVISKGYEMDPENHVLGKVEKTDIHKTKFSVVRIKLYLHGSKRHLISHFSATGNFLLIRVSYTVNPLIWIVFFNCHRKQRI